MNKYILPYMFMVCEMEGSVNDILIIYYIQQVSETKLTSNSFNSIPCYCLTSTIVINIIQKNALFYSAI
jgi:hypothetical protein